MSKIKVTTKQVFISTTGRKFFTERGAVRCSIAEILRRNYGNCNCQWDGNNYGYCMWHEFGDPSKLIDKWYQAYLWVKGVKK